MQSIQARRVQTLAICFAAIALLAMVTFAVQREVRGKTSAAPAVAKAAAHQARALTPAEDAYADALWPIHSEAKLNAVKMSFAGLSFKTEERNLAKLDAKLQPLIEGFKAAALKMSGLEVPPSLRKTHDQYFEALTLYESAAIEMAKITQEGDEAHLLKAQTMSLRASENLLRVGEVLWPAEHKPH